jgi:hypothetical protein
MTTPGVRVHAYYTQSQSQHSSKIGLFMWAGLRFSQCLIKGHLTWPFYTHLTRRMASHTTKGNDREILKRIMASFRDDTRLSDGVTLYERTGTYFFPALHISAVVQLLLWFNAAWLAFDYLAVEKKEEKDTTKQHTIAPLWQRCLVAGGILAVGSTISGALILYASRCVTRLRLVKDGTFIQVETAGLGYLGRTREWPVYKVSMQQRAWTGQGHDNVEKIRGSQHLYLRVHGERMSYVLDRLGRFYEPRILDALLYRPTIKSR